MISGTKSARTTACAISSLEEAHRRRRQHLAEKQRGSQPARLRIIAQTNFEVRRVEGLHAADLLDVFGRLFLHDVDDVVER